MGLVLIYHSSLTEHMSSKTTPFRLSFFTIPLVHNVNVQTSLSLINTRDLSQTSSIDNVSIIYVLDASGIEDTSTSLISTIFK